jgi:hypothetical protein
MDLGDVRKDRLEVQRLEVQRTQGSNCVGDRCNYLSTNFVTTHKVRTTAGSTPKSLIPTHEGKFASRSTHKVRTTGGSTPPTGSVRAVPASTSSGRNREYVIAGVEGSGFEISQNPKKGRSSPSTHEMSKGWYVLNEDILQWVPLRYRFK